MELIRARAHNGVGYCSVTVADLGVEDRVAHIDLLDGFRRRHKTSVARSRETLSRIVRDAVERQTIVTTAAVGSDLHRNSAKRLRELACLALEVATGAGIDNTCCEGRQYERVAANVWKVGHFLGAQRRCDLGRPRIQQRVISSDSDGFGDGASGELEIDFLKLPGRENNPCAGFALEPLGRQTYRVGSRVQRRKAIGAGCVCSRGRLEMSCRLLSDHRCAGYLCSVRVAHFS